MQPPLDDRPGRGPRPSTTSAEEKKSVQAARGRGVCQSSTVLKRSTSGSPVERSAYQCSPGRRRPAAPLSQVAHTDATKKDTDSFDARSHHQETSYEYLAETFSACGESQRGSDLEQQRGWPSAHGQPASSRVSNHALPDVAKIAKSFSIDGDGGSNPHSRYSQVRHNADFGRSERGTVRENSANARNIHHAANVLTSGCSQASLPETQQCLQSDEVLKRGTWSSPVRVEPALQRPSCDESPFFRKDSPEHINSLFGEEQRETTVSPARCHTPGPIAGDISTCAGLDVHQLYQERGSAVPYLSTMYGTACSSELLDPAIQSSVDGGSFTKETSDCTKGGARRGFSSGSQALSPRASISSTFTSFTRSGCSSASTASYASPQRQSECCRAEALDPSVSCSLDLASFSVACQTPPLKSQDISDLPKPTTIADRQSSPSTPALLAVTNADRLPASPVADLRDTKSGEGVPPNAPDNSRNDSTKDRGLTAPATKASQAASDPISDVSPTSSALADVSGFSAADVNISDIVLSCGLPPPESSAPVSLACRVLMRRYAAAAAAAAEAASRREAGGEKGEGREGERGSPLKTLKESSRRVRVEQFEDCGWTWQGDGGGLLLLRLQRKQLDKGKVKSAGYEAFGREYGLPVGRSMNNVPPWNLVFSHINTPMQKDVFKSIITDIRRHFTCAAANTYNSGRVLEGTSFSTEPSSHVNQSASAEGGWLGKYPLAETQKSHAEETVLTTAPLNPPPCRRSLSNGGPPAGSNGFMKRESAARTSAGVSGRGWALKETDGWSIRGKGEIEDRTFASGWGSGSSQSDLEMRPCHCCGDRRKQLVGCTRSASLLESRGEGIADGIGMAAMLSSATQQRSSEGGRGRPTSLSGSELQRKTPESNKQKYAVAAAAASRHSGKRHSTCEGRLEGWRAQQLSVRVILRNTEPPPPPLVRETLPDPAPPRLRKRVTFSVDCFSSDGETTPGVLCRLSPPVQQEAPLRRPLISRVHSSTYRQAGGLLSRSRSDCASVAAAAAPLAAGGRTTVAALTAGAREEKRGEIGPATQKDGREVAGRAADAARQPRGGEDSSSSTSLKGSPPDAGCAPAADVPRENNPPREESFYILVGCRRPTAASRWTRRGRTVVSRNCSRYVGPLLPLVISLLEREREAVRDHGTDERPQTKEDDRGKTQRLKKESPFHWLRRSSPAAESLQQQQVKHPQQQQHPQKQQQQQHSQTQQQQHQQRQQQQQGLLQHQAPRVPQQQLPQQKQPAQPSAQRRQPPQQQQQMLTKQQGQLQTAWRGDEQRQEQAAAVRRSAAGEVARRDPLPRQGWDPVRNEERYSSGGGWRPRDYAIYQPPRAPCTHVCPRYYHPLDTPETLFPQARARQLRRLLMLQNGSAFPAVNDPLVLANGLPLLQGGAAAVGALGDGNLAAYQQLGRCSVAARAVAQAAAARRPPVLPQLCHPLQQQHSQRERFFSSPYSLPESSADAQGRLRYGSGGLSGAAGVSPGIWYRRGRSGPVEPLRQAGSCSFTFEPGSVDGGLSAEGMRPPGGGAARRFDTDEDEEEDDEDEEEEEGDFRRRLPRFFRRRRSSDAAAGQGETEERRRLSRFSSLTRRTPQDASSGGRRITTGERLKRFLVPLFFRGFSSPAADAERQGGEGEGEEDGEQAEVVQENEGAAATRNKDSEQPPEQLGAQLPEEEDDEDLWVTESDASTPPLSSQSSIVIVKKKAAQLNQQQMERTSVREGKGGNGQTVGPPNTPQDTAAGRILRRSATADDVRPSPRLQKPRGRQPRTPALKKVTEEPVEEAKTAGKRSSALEVHGAAEKQGTTHHQAEDRKTAVAATEQKPKQNSCESGGQALQQQTDEQFLELQEMQREQRPPQRPEEEEGKQVEEKSPHQQQCRPQPHETRQQRQQKGENECRGQQALQQTTAAAAEKKLSVEGRRPENEEPRGQQDQQTKRQKPQQPPEHRPQQRKRQQQQQGLPVDREQTVREKPKAEHRAEAERAQKPTAHGIKKPHAKDEELQRRRLEKEEAGISGTLKEVGSMQKQKKERDERRTESLVGGDEGNSVDAERQAIAKTRSPLKQRPCVLPVKRDRNSAGGVTERRPCEQPSAEQQGGRPQVHDDAQPTCAPELGVAAPEVCVSEKKEVPQTCEQQPALEEGPPASLKVFAISGLCSKAEKSVLEDSSSNNENDVCGAGRDVLHTRKKRDGLVDCKRANDRPTGENICVTGPPKEKPEGKKQEEGEGKGFGGACSLGDRRSPVPAASRPATLSALAEDDVASEGTTPHNAPNTALLMRQGFLANRLCSAEARVLPAQEDNRRRTGGGLRWRWKRSSGRGREDKAVEGVVGLSSPAATASGFSQIGQSAAPAAVLTTAAVPAAGTGASPTAAASAAAATLTLCADEQVASSTAAGSQQTVSSPLHGWRVPSKKNSLLTAFDQMPSPWSTRSTHENREEQRNLPTLLQRLSTRFRRRRDFGANDSSEQGGAQCTSDTG